jgi:acetyl-CoA synthetase
MNRASQFLEARDFLLKHHEDYQAAVAGFRWPRLAGFNWALDYFDDFARGNERPALCILDEDGSRSVLSFAQMAERSSRLANFLRGVGVRRGDRIFLMLSNQVALWEAMLASIKLGAVIIPATVLLTDDDIADRLGRGGVRHVIVKASDAHRFDALDSAISRICVGGRRDGWTTYEDCYESSAAFEPEGPTQAKDPLLLYFTSGTTARPKLVMHTHESYPVGHLSTMYWIGLRPGDVHWNISSPGWAKHAWSCFFAPWNAGATVFIYNFARFVGKAVLETLRDNAVTSLCAPPTVWRLLIQEDLAARPVKLRELTSAGEPLNP